ncbi:hypothetical protein AP285_15885 [Limnospira platensis YZ]|nr:hypothetical protein AP285_15885 [Arthrospira platensis YZ]
MGSGGFINIVNYPLIAGWGRAGLLILSVSPITNCGTRPYNYPLLIIHYPLIAGWGRAGLLILSIIH